MLVGEPSKGRIRSLRKEICFPIVNRGKAWYDMLSFEQVAELEQWYRDWLNATETGIVPQTPAWLSQKLNTQEETIL